MPTLTTLRQAILASLYGSATLAAFSPAAMAQSNDPVADRKSVV